MKTISALVYQPVVERLEALEAAWDGMPRLGSWLVDYCGASAEDEDSALYLAEVGLRFLIGVVARAYPVLNIIKCWC